VIHSAASARVERRLYCFRRFPGTGRLALITALIAGWTKRNLRERRQRHKQRRDLNTEEEVEQGPAL
jgi:hypothetical protein